MGGTISLIGVLSGRVSDLDIVPILMQKIRVQGVMVGHRESFEAMMRKRARTAFTMRIPEKAADPD